MDAPNKFPFLQGSTNFDRINFSKNMNSLLSNIPSLTDMSSNIITTFIFACMEVFEQSIQSGFDGFSSGLMRARRQTEGEVQYVIGLLIKFLNFFYNKLYLAKRYERLKNKPSTPSVDDLVTEILKSDENGGDALSSEQKLLIFDEKTEKLKNIINNLNTSDSNKELSVMFRSLLDKRISQQQPQVAQPVGLSNQPTQAAVIQQIAYELKQEIKEKTEVKLYQITLNNAFTYLVFTYGRLSGKAISNLFDNISILFGGESQGYFAPLSMSSVSGMVPGVSVAKEFMTKFVDIFKQAIKNARSDVEHEVELSEKNMQIALSTANKKFTGGGEPNLASKLLKKFDDSTALNKKNVKALKEDSTKSNSQSKAQPRSPQTSKEVSPEIAIKRSNITIARLQHIRDFELIIDYLTKKSGSSLSSVDKYIESKPRFPNFSSSKPEKTLFNKLTTAEANSIRANSNVRKKLEQLKLPDDNTLLKESELYINTLIENNKNDFKEKNDKHKKKLISIVTSSELIQSTKNKLITMIDPSVSDQQGGGFLFDSEQTKEEKKSLRELIAKLSGNQYEVLIESKKEERKKHYEDLINSDKDTGLKKNKDYDIDKADQYKNKAIKTLKVIERSIEEVDENSKNIKSGLNKLISFLKFTEYGKYNKYYDNVKNKMKEGIKEFKRLKGGTLSNSAIKRRIKNSTRRIQLSLENFNRSGNISRKIRNKVSKKTRRQKNKH